MKSTDHNHDEQDADPFEYAQTNLRESLVYIRQLFSGSCWQAKAKDSSSERE
jgi:hypothetical protein